MIKKKKPFRKQYYLKVKSINSRAKMFHLSPGSATSWLRVGKFSSEQLKVIIHKACGRISGTYMCQLLL